MNCSCKLWANWRKPLLLVLVVTFLAELFSTAAGQVLPEVGYVYPPVLPAGSKVEVVLGGYDFTSDMQFFVHDEQIELEPLGEPGEFFVPGPPYWFGTKSRSAAAPIPREIPARLTIPAEMPRGLVHWQVANANGSSPCGVFYISDLPEVLESRRGDRVQTLASVPVGVSGRLSRIAEVDRYAFVAPANGLVTIDAMVQRLGAKWRASLEVYDAAGELVGDAVDTAGNDPQITLSVRQGEVYTVRLADVDFRGNRSAVYHLGITVGPRVQATRPARGQRGVTSDVEIIGIGVATGANQVESVMRSIAFPADERQQTVDYRLETEFGVARPYRIPLGKVPESVHALQAGKGLPVVVAFGTAVTGRLDGVGQTDRYSFIASQGQVLRLFAEARSLGSPLDIAFDIEDAEGNILASADDMPTSPDPELIWTAPAEGEFKCVVRDVAGQVNSPAAIYRFTIESVVPDFRLEVPQQINVALGAKFEIPIKVIRLAGFQGEIDLAMTGLPAGVTISGEAKIPADKNDFKLSVEAAADAATTASVVRIVGKTIIDEQVQERVAMAPITGNLSPRSAEEQRSSKLLLTTTMKAPFKLKLVDRRRQRAVHRGTTYPAPFVIERDAGFDGEVQLQMAAKQARHRQGIRGPFITVPAGVNQALYPCFMPEWLETDLTRRMTVMALTELDDPQGKRRQLTVPGDYRVTMMLEGALLKLSHRAEELSVVSGESFEIPLEIFRSIKLTTSVTIELMPHQDLTGLLSTQTLQLGPNQNEAVMKIATEPSSESAGDWNIQLKATALQEGQWPVISYVEVPLRLLATSSAAGE